MSLLLASVVNAQDGSNVTATIDGSPVGTLTFWSNQVPHSATARQMTYTGAGPYSVTLQDGGINYLWAKDDNGFSANCLPVILSATNNLLWNELGEFWRDTLIEHKDGIECAMAQWFAGTTIKEIVYGSPRDVQAWPAIIVSTDIREATRYLATEFVRDIQVYLTILCVVVHNDESTEAALGVRLAQIVSDIMNLTQYESINLASGASVGFGICNNAGIRSVPAGKRFSMAGTLQWSCRTSSQGKI